MGFSGFLVVQTFNCQDIYTIGFIGRETNEESDRLFEQGNVICPVYNDSMELEGDIYYEE
jgi:hypothetical protein